jgi:hypothetical protein
MTAAVALAVVLVIAVAGVSLAMQTQRPVQQQQQPRTPPPPRRPARERRSAAPTPPKAPPPPVPKEPESKGPELLRSGVAATAKVISVVDERTLGPVTRSRLNLKVEPEGEAGFEVTVRVAFPTPEARARVKVGGTVPVRFDKDDHGRVVIDPPEDT